MRTLACMATFFLMFMASGAQAHSSEWCLSLQHGRSGHVYHTQAVTTGDTFELRWVHSVELTPWIEAYRVEADGTLTLYHTRFQSYGAGAPEGSTAVRAADGWFFIDDVNRPLPGLRWIHSHAAHHEIWQNGTRSVSAPELPHHEPILLTVTRSSL